MVQLLIQLDLTADNGQEKKRLIRIDLTAFDSTRKSYTASKKGFQNGTIQCCRQPLDRKLSDVEGFSIEAMNSNPARLVLI